METLKQKTARGLFWGGMNTMVQQVIGLLFGIILGRLLAPSDYGMMAIISVFSLVAVALQDSGFKVALANEKAPTHADYNAVFWFNILMGIALYAALFLSAPLIGRWYNTPQVVPLCRYAFLSIVVASMGTAQSAWLFKNLRAKQIAKASMPPSRCRAARAPPWPTGRWPRRTWCTWPSTRRRPVTPHQHAPAAGAAPSGASSTPSSSHGTARSLTWSRGEISI